MQSILDSCGPLVRLAIALLRVPCEVLKGLVVTEVRDVKEMEKLPTLEGALLREIGGEDALWFKRLRDFHRRAVTNADRAHWAEIQSELVPVEVPGEMLTHHSVRRVFSKDPETLPVGFLDEGDLKEYLQHLAVGDSMFGDDDRTAEARDIILDLFGQAKPEDFRDKHRESLRRVELDEVLCGKTEKARTDRPFDGGPDKTYDLLDGPPPDPWKTFPHWDCTPVGEKVRAADNPCIIMGRLPRIYAGKEGANSFKDLRRIYPTGISPKRWDSRYYVSTTVAAFQGAVGELQLRYPPEVCDQFVDIDANNTIQLYKMVQFSREPEKKFWFLAMVKYRVTVGWLTNDVGELILLGKRKGYGVSRVQHLKYISDPEKGDPHAVIAVYLSKELLIPKEGWESVSIPNRKGVWTPEKSGCAVRFRTRIYPNYNSAHPRTAGLWSKLPRRYELQLDAVNTKAGLRFVVQA